MLSPLVLDAHQALRQATAAAHARIDAVVGSGLRTAVDYGVYLRGMHRFIVVSQLALTEAGGDLAWYREWLEADLASLQLTPLRDRVSMRLDSHPVAQLGWEYVIAGAAMGARYLLRNAQTLGYSSDHGARFLAGHAAGSHWPCFLVRLQRANLSGPDLQRLGDAALAAFAAAESAFKTAQQEARHE